ncbi:MAG: hypothetical protein MJ175_07720 [Clostridia bacterium]|nr:hypothetical protein [Clostridia bacterium]
MKDTELYTAIISTYKDTGSVSRTADILGTNNLRVRRVLITEGLWSSKTSKAIGELYAQGMSVADIAKRLIISEKNVQSYLPYTKGMYTEDDRSNDGIRSKRYRTRKSLIADQHLDITPREHYIEGTLPQGEHHESDHTCALRIHLELNTESLTPKEMADLRKLALADQSISREIIVPADITLHALHYVIQALFGWQNSHLHHFSFPDEVFDELTQGRFIKWCSLCGIYFRFPSEEDDDLFWDDDYSGMTSFKNWLRSKYKGPYSYHGIGDYYLENQSKVQKLKKDLPEFDLMPSFTDYLISADTEKTKKRIVLEKASINEFTRSVFLGGELNYLLERLTLSDYLYLTDNDSYYEPIDGRIRFLEHDLDLMIKHWNKIMLREYENADAIALIAGLTTTRMQPQSDYLDYYYDYGDGWNVRITRTGVYYEESLADNEIVRKVYEKHAPVCVAADGLSVMDDVGGIFGYLDFLKEIHGKVKSSDSDDMLLWAKEQGWKGKPVMPEKML